MVQEAVEESKQCRLDHRWCFESFFYKSNILESLLHTVKENSFFLLYQISLLNYVCCSPSRGRPQNKPKHLMTDSSAKINELKKRLEFFFGDVSSLLFSFCVLCFVFWFNCDFIWRFSTNKKIDRTTHNISFCRQTWVAINGWWRRLHRQPTVM